MSPTYQLIQYHNNGTIVIEQKEDEDEDDDSTSVTDVIKLEADFD